MYTVDDKNRISIPAQFRKELPDGFVITKGPDGCLWVLPPDRWQIMLDRASASPAIQRFFLASACHCKPCAKGRYLLPDNLRRHADIKPGDEVAIVGLLDRMEIWSARRWDTVCSQLTSDRIRQELPEFFEMR
ncbi:division/cell wall cluster transcriptional repressor MraZ [bacterium]|nr:division/cell wall cluster transcriptional repressor MraZ [bacterium]